MAKTHAQARTMHSLRCRRWLLALFLAASPFCFAFGLSLPLVRFEKLYVFTESPSLLAIVVSLWEDGNALLAAVMCLFSIVFPATKIIAVTLEITGSGACGKHGTVFARAMPILSKWSMTDVLVVAIVIVAAKTSGVASAFTQPGLWFYAASALMTALAHVLVRRTGAAG